MYAITLKIKMLHFQNSSKVAERGKIYTTNTQIRVRVFAWTGLVQPLQKKKWWAYSVMGPTPLLSEMI